MSEILALYDITGIQEYIFKTNKLKDIIGGSELVSMALGENAETLLSECGGKIVYSGGGYAVFAFDGKDNYIKFNRAFSSKLLIEMPGLNLETVYCEKRNDLGNEIQLLYDKMVVKKNTVAEYCEFYTLPPMVQSTPDQEQVVCIDLNEDDGGELSFSAMRKREKGNEEEKGKMMTVFDAIAESFAEQHERIMAVVPLF